MKPTLAEDVIKLAFYNPDDACDNSLGLLIRRHRREKKLRQKDVAEKIGIAFPHYCTWEKGHHRPRTLESLKKLIDILGMNPEETLTYYRK